MRLAVSSAGRKAEAHGSRAGLAGPGEVGLLHNHLCHVHELVSVAHPACTQPRSVSHPIPVPGHTPNNDHLPEARAKGRASSSSFTGSHPANQGGVTYNPQKTCYSPVPNCRQGMAAAWHNSGGPEGRRALDGGGVAAPQALRPLELLGGDHQVALVPVVVCVPLRAAPDAHLVAPVAEALVRTARLPCSPACPISENRIQFLLSNRWRPPLCLAAGIAASLEKFGYWLYIDR